MEDNGDDNVKSCGENTKLKVSLGAIQDKDFEAKLTFVAPKGVEEAGAVQFKIKADVALEEGFFIRAGYSANASIELEKKEDILAIDEGLLQYDKETEKPYVEVQTGEQTFERREVELGISDGINVEVISGVSEEDKIKVWNIKSLKKNQEGEEETESEEDGSN